MPAIEHLLEPIFSHFAVRAFLGAALEPSPPSRSHRQQTITLAGLTASAKALVVAGVIRELDTHSLDRPLLVITGDNEAAARLAETTGTFLNWIIPRPGAKDLPSPEPRDSLGVLPGFDCSPYEGRSPHAEILEERAVALWNLAHGRTRALFAPLPAALGRFRDRSFYASLALEIKLNDELNLDDLIEHLVSVGYESAEPVSNAGQYSVRGGIVDVFPPEAANPVRIEFFGDSVESLREFDSATQRSRKSTALVLLLPLAATTRSPQFFSRLAGHLARREAERRHTKQPTTSPPLGPVSSPALPASEYLETASQADPVNPSGGTDSLTGLSVPFPGWEFFVPGVEPHPNTLLSLLTASLAQPRNGRDPNAMLPPLVIWDEKPQRTRQLRLTVEGWKSAYEEVRDATPAPPLPEEVFLTEDEFWRSLEPASEVSLKELPFSMPEESSFVTGPLSLAGSSPNSDPKVPNAAETESTRGANFRFGHGRNRSRHASD